MKYIVILGDGMADRPLEELSGKTPLEAARNPNMDFIAREGCCGLLKTIPDSMEPGSDVANMSILGYDPHIYYTGGRGPLEAASMGIKLERDDIAVRCNLITEDKGVIKDYSGGHISTEEASELVDHINKELGTDSINFHPGVGYRHILVLEGGYSEKIQCMPPHDIMGQKTDENMIKPVDESAKKTAELLNELMLKSRKILSEHPVNLEKIKKGENPANMLWFWGAGKKPQMPTFREKFGLNGALISAVDLLKGIAVCLGLEVINVPGATAYLDTNYEGKADYAIKALEDKDFIYVHIEAPDEAGHEGDINGKIKAIEEIDEKIVGRILKSIKDEFTIAVLSDHATPIKVRTHTREPVPFAIYSKSKKGDNVRYYNEKAAVEGSYGIRNGVEFMTLLIENDR